MRFGFAVGSGVWGWFVELGGVELAAEEGGLGGRGLPVALLFFLQELAIGGQNGLWHGCERGGFGRQVFLARL